MLNLIFIDFFNNFLLYNFLNIYKKQHLEYFVIDFNIKYIEGNFPHSFFTQYNYLSKNQNKFIEKKFIHQLLQYNIIPICLDLNNKNLKVNDLIDKYLLMILLTLNYQNNYIHCNNHQICEILYTSGLEYIYIDDNYFKIINQPKINNNEEEKIYNFSNIITNINNNTLINFNELDKNITYKIMLNDKLAIINNLILPEYQFIFYKDYLDYEKEMLCYSGLMGKI